MSKKYTILEAAREVLLSSDNYPMSVAEIYAMIKERALYTFRAQDPVSVLRGELRSHSLGIDFPTASSKKYFVYDESCREFRVLLAERRGGSHYKGRGDSEFPPWNGTLQSYPGILCRFRRLSHGV